MIEKTAIPSNLVDRRFNRALRLIGDGEKPADACRKVGLKRSTFYARYARAKTKYQAMDAA